MDKHLYRGPRGIRKSPVIINRRGRNRRDGSRNRSSNHSPRRIRSRSPPRACVSRSPRRYKNYDDKPKTIAEMKYGRNRFNEKRDADLDTYNRRNENREWKDEREFDVDYREIDAYNRRNKADSPEVSRFNREYADNFSKSPIPNNAYDNDVDRPEANFRDYNDDYEKYNKSQLEPYYPPQQNDFEPPHQQQDTKTYAGNRDSPRPHIKQENMPWTDANIEKESERPFDMKNSFEPPTSHSALPEFNGGDATLSARQWLRLVEDVAVKHNWTPDEIKYHMTCKLAGFARQWFTTSCNTDGNWLLIKKQFLQVFPSDMEYHNLLQEMFLRKKRPTESMASYFKDKLALLSSCGLSGQKAISCLIGSCSMEKVKKEELYNKDFKSVDDLYEFLTKELGEKKEELSVEDYKPFYNRRQRKRIKNKQIMNSKQSKTPVMLGNLSSVPIYERFFTTIRLNGSSCNGYIDFNSEHVTIKEDFAKLANLNVRKSYKIVKGFNGSPISALGEAFIFLYVYNTTADVVGYIVPNHVQAIPVIVGQSFISHRNVHVTEKQDTVIFSNAKSSHQ